MMAHTASLRRRRRRRKHEEAQVTLAQSGVGNEDRNCRVHLGRLSLVFALPPPLPLRPPPAPAPKPKSTSTTMTKILSVTTTITLLIMLATSLEAGSAQKQVAGDRMSLEQSTGADPIVARGGGGGESVAPVEALKASESMNVAPSAATAAATSTLTPRIGNHRLPAPTRLRQSNERRNQIDGRGADAARASKLTPPTVSKRRDERRRRPRRQQIALAPSEQSASRLVDCVDKTQAAEATATKRTTNEPNRESPSILLLSGWHQIIGAEEKKSGKRPPESSLFVLAADEARPGPLSAEQLPLAGQELGGRERGAAKSGDDYPGERQRSQVASQVSAPIRQYAATLAASESGAIPDREQRDDKVSLHLHSSRVGPLSLPLDERTGGSGWPNVSAHQSAARWPASSQDDDASWQVNPVQRLRRSVPQTLAKSDVGGGGGADVGLIWPLERAARLAVHRHHHHHRHRKPRHRPASEELRRLDDMISKSNEPYWLNFRPVELGGAAKSPSLSLLSSSMGPIGSAAAAGRQPEDKDIDNKNIVHTSPPLDKDTERVVILKDADADAPDYYYHHYNYQEAEVEPRLGAPISRSRIRDSGYVAYDEIPTDGEAANLSVEFRHRSSQIHQLAGSGDQAEDIRTWRSGRRLKVSGRGSSSEGASGEMLKMDEPFTQKQQPNYLLLRQSEAQQHHEQSSIQRSDISSEQKQQLAEEEATSSSSQFGMVANSTSAPFDYLTTIDPISGATIDTITGLELDPVTGTPFARWSTITIAILIGLCVVLTVLGNILVLMSFVYERTIRQPSNYLICSLALSDLFIGIVSMPFFAIYVLRGWRWTLGPFWCDIWLATDHTLCLISIYTVLLITVDRFFSIKTPTKYREWRTKRKVIIMVIITWLVPFAIFFGTIMSWDWITGKRDLKEYECAVQFLKNPLFNTSLILFYFYSTLAIMFVLYAGIYKTARDLAKKAGNKQKRMQVMMAMQQQQAEMIARYIGTTEGPGGGGGGGSGANASGGSGGNSSSDKTGGGAQVTGGLVRVSDHDRDATAKMDLESYEYAEARDKITDEQSMDRLNRRPRPQRNSVRVSRHEDARPGDSASKDSGGQYKKNLIAATSSGSKSAASGTHQVSGGMSSDQRQSRDQKRRSRPSNLVDLEASHTNISAGHQRYVVDEFERESGSTRSSSPSFESDDNSPPGRSPSRQSSLKRDARQAQLARRKQQQQQQQSKALIGQLRQVRQANKSLRASRAVVGRGINLFSKSGSGNNDTDSGVGGAAGSGANRNSSMSMRQNSHGMRPQLPLIPRSPIITRNELRDFMILNVNTSSSEANLETNGSSANATAADIKSSSNENKQQQQHKPEDSSKQQVFVTKSDPPLESLVAARKSIQLEVGNNNGELATLAATRDKSAAGSRKSSHQLVQVAKSVEERTNPLLRETHSTSDQSITTDSQPREAAEQRQPNAFKCTCCHSVSRKRPSACDSPARLGQSNLYLSIRNCDHLSNSSSLNSSRSLSCSDSIMSSSGRCGGGGRGAGCGGSAAHHGYELTASISSMSSYSRLSHCGCCSICSNQTVDDICDYQSQQNSTQNANPQQQPPNASSKISPRASCQIHANHRTKHLNSNHIQSNSLNHQLAPGDPLARRRSGSIMTKGSARGHRFCGQRDESGRSQSKSMVVLADGQLGDRKLSHTGSSRRESHRHNHRPSEPNVVLINEDTVKIDNNCQTQSEAKQDDPKKTDEVSKTKETQTQQQQQQQQQTASGWFGGALGALSRSNSRRKQSEPQRGVESQNGSQIINVGGNIGAANMRELVKSDSKIGVTSLLASVGLKTANQAAAAANFAPKSRLRLFSRDQTAETNSQRADKSPCEDQDQKVHRRSTDGGHGHGVGHRNSAAIASWVVSPLVRTSGIVTKRRRGMGLRHTSKSENRARKALRTISFILGAFVLCWTPYHILALVAGFCTNPDGCVNTHLFYFTYFLCYTNSPINPFCYALANAQFKRAFYRVLKCNFGSWQPAPVKK